MSPLISQFFSGNVSTVRATLPAILSLSRAAMWKESLFFPRGRFGQRRFAVSFEVNTNAMTPLDEAKEKSRLAALIKPKLGLGR